MYGSRCESAEVRRGRVVARSCPTMAAGATKAPWLILPTLLPLPLILLSSARCSFSQGHPGGVGDRRPDAADEGAHPLGASGKYFRPWPMLSVFLEERMSGVICVDAGKEAPCSLTQLVCSQSTASFGFAERGIEQQHQPRVALCFCDDAPSVGSVCRMSCVELGTDRLARAKAVASLCRHNVPHHRKRLARSSPRG